MVVSVAVAVVAIVVGALVASVVTLSVSLTVVDTLVVGAAVVPLVVVFDPWSPQDTFISAARVRANTKAIMRVFIFDSLKSTFLVAATI